MSTEPVNPMARIYIELQGMYIRGSLIVYIVVPRVIYAKSRQKIAKKQDFRFLESPIYKFMPKKLLK